MQLSMVILYLFSICKKNKYITVGKLKSCAPATKELSFPRKLQKANRNNTGDSSVRWKHKR